MVLRPYPCMVLCSAEVIFETLLYMEYTLVHCVLKFIPSLLEFSVYLSHHNVKHVLLSYIQLVIQAVLLFNLYLTIIGYSSCAPEPTNSQVTWK